MWKSVQAALELDEPFDVGIPIELTDELEPARARELLATTRAEPGWCALLVDAGANHLLGELAGAERVRAALADYERASPVIARASAEPIEQALTRLGEVTGMDPLAVLHRLEGDTLGAIEGDDVEFDADMLLPEASPSGCLCSLRGGACRSAGCACRVRRPGFGAGHTAAHL